MLKQEYLSKNLDDALLFIEYDVWLQCAAPDSVVLSTWYMVNILEI